MVTQLDVASLSHSHREQEGVLWTAIGHPKAVHLICTGAVRLLWARLSGPLHSLTKKIFLFQSLKCMLLNDNPRSHTHQRRHSLLRKNETASVNHPWTFTPVSLQTQCSRHLLEEENIFRGFSPCSCGFPCGSNHYRHQTPDNPPTISPNLSSASLPQCSALNCSLQFSPPPSPDLFSSLSLSQRADRTSHVGLQQLPFTASETIAVQRI